MMCSRGLLIMAKSSKSMSKSQVKYPLTNPFPNVLSKERSEKYRLISHQVQSCS